MSEFGDITAIIPTWNRADLLHSILKQLAQQTYPIHQIIVVDNGSSDDSEKVAVARGATFIPLGSNRGFAGGVNRGILEAKTEWVVILNNDVTLDAGWLSTLVTAAAGSGAGFATGKLLTMDRRLLDSTFDLVSRGATAWRCGTGRPDGPPWNEQRRISCAPLTAALFRRDVFDTVGALDERFESYLEDVDLGIRCTGAGIFGIFVPAALGCHAGSATRGPWHKATVRQIARNQLFLFHKHFRSAPRWPAVVAQVLWGLVAARHGCLAAWFAGKWEGYRRRGEFEHADGRWQRIQQAIEESEADLLQLQRRTGFDAYWRCYFLLTGGRRR